MDASKIVSGLDLDKNQTLFNKSFIRLKAFIMNFGQLFHK